MKSSRLLIDFTPLHASMPYRTLFGGQMISLLGTQLTTVALPLQVYLLTHSSLAVGLIGLVQIGPALILTLYGGAIADALDRRLVLLATQLFLFLTTGTLTLVTLLPHPALWLLYVLAALLAGIAGVDGPTRGATTRNLVRREHFAAAAGLNALMYQLGAVLGPALAGFIIGHFSLAVAYGLDTATYSAAILAVLLLPPQIPQGKQSGAGWTALREGLRYVRGQQIVQGILLTDSDAMIFGMPRALFPALGLTVFGGGAQTVGWLYAAPALGALVGAFSSGWVGQIRWPGRAVLILVGLWGLAITIFGLSTWLPLALLMLACAGWADIISEVLRSTMLQLTIPDNLRGRVTAVWLAQTNGTARLGDVESGLVAALSNAQVSAATGGIACCIGVLGLAWLLPTFRQARLDDSTLPH